MPVSGSLAPFASYMKLGQGFNSYTQDVCIEDAVLITPRIEEKPGVVRRKSTIHGVPIDNAPRTGTFNSNEVIHEQSEDTRAAEGNKDHKSQDHVPVKLPNGAEIAALSTTSQIVSYSSRYIENMQDIMDSMNISSASMIKYGGVKGGGSASFVDESTVNAADINYIISCHVTNEVSTIPDDMMFNAVDALDASNFTELYGDCFISGFLEGGSFDAVVSIKVHDKSKVKSVKAAAEAEIAIAAVPGLTVETKNSFEKDKSKTWKDTETTIAVNYSGGGQVKKPATHWDLQAVMDAACRFPFLVQHESQRTSAILTPYTALRSFMEHNSKLPVADRLHVKDYSLCSLYTHDLFSAYMAYKNLWTEASAMLKNMKDYKAREKSPECPDPIQVNPIALNQARLIARKNMIIISKETSSLALRPEIADLDASGDIRPMPQAPPALLAARMPIKIDMSESSDVDAHLDAASCAFLGRLMRNTDIHIHPLSGDTPLTDCTTTRGVHRTFSTVHPSDRALNVPLRFRFHAHKHRHLDLFADFAKHSRNSEGYLSAIGVSTAQDISSGTEACGDGMHKHIGKVNSDESYWSQIADTTIKPVGSVMIEWIQGSGKIAGLALRDEDGNEMTSWRAYGQAKMKKPKNLKVDDHTLPERDGWVLLGFWGHCDVLVITQLGTIWKRH